MQTSSDLLKCGSCRSEFLLSDIVVFIQHKTSSACKLVEQQTEVTDKNITPISTTTNSDLTCGTCPQTFSNARSLLEHAQYTHKINIFVNSQSPATTTTSSSSVVNNTPSTQANNSSQQTPNTSNHKNNSTNEIFIDFVQSDKHCSANGSSPTYNITVSSSNNNNNNNNSNSSTSDHKDLNSNGSLLINKSVNMSPKKKLLNYTYDSMQNNTASNNHNNNSVDIKIESNENDNTSSKVINENNLNAPADLSLRTPVTSKY